MTEERYRKLCEVGFVFESQKGGPRFNKSNRPYETKTAQAKRKAAEQEENADNNNEEDGRSDYEDDDDEYAVGAYL